MLSQVVFIYLCICTRIHTYIKPGKVAMSQRRNMGTIEVRVPWRGQEKEINGKSDVILFNFKCNSIF